jgi:hypothetical protein
VLVGVEVEVALERVLVPVFVVGVSVSDVCVAVIEVLDIVVSEV